MQQKNSASFGLEINEPLKRERENGRDNPPPEHSRKTLDIPYFNVAHS